MNTLPSANLTDGNILLKECSYKIKITYSRSARAEIRQLANADITVVGDGTEKEQYHTATLPAYE